MALTPTSLISEFQSHSSNWIVLTHKKKRYLINPADLKLHSYHLGQGSTGSVIKLKCSVESAQHQKVKEFAVKIFHSINPNVHTAEFNCHQEIIRRIAEKKDVLSKQGITPGNGIEKPSLFAFSHHGKSYMLKKLYDHNLTTAIQAGVFKETAHLLAAAQQLLEGILSLQCIGALYFDLKPANIVVGRSGKLEVALTDFEKISFLNFDAKDNEIIKKSFVSMPIILAHEKELNQLTDSSPNPKIFVAKLSKIYAFAMGAAFFEMSTKISLKKFILIKFFKAYLQQSEAPETVSKFWEEALNTEDKNLGQLITKLDDKFIAQFYLVINHTIYPDIELLQTKVLQEGIRDQMKQCNIPAFFINMTASLLHIESSQRMTLQEALQSIQANHS